MVVKKLGPAIPKCGFILVAFEDELFPAAESVTLSKVFRHASYGKIWPFARCLENPSQHRRGGGFSMGSADDDRMPFGKKHFFQHFRHRPIRNPAIQHLL